MSVDRVSERARARERERERVTVFVFFCFCQALVGLFLVKLYSMYSSWCYRTTTRLYCAEASPTRTLTWSTYWQLYLGAPNGLRPKIESQSCRMQGLKTLVDALMSWLLISRLHDLVHIWVLVGRNFTILL